MHIEIATLFPEMCESVLDTSIIGRARQAGFIDVHCTQIREYALDKHHRVDDSPYGGGKGMVMMCEPIFLCYEDICRRTGSRPHVIYMSPRGRVFTQEDAKRLCALDNIMILCGHYEGVDERILETIVDEEISIGDYVLTGGELPALVITDAIARMCPGVLAADVCFTEESHYNGLLEYPQYTRPEQWHGMNVPDELLNGNHSVIEKYRHEQSLSITKERRPDMYEKYMDEERKKQLDTALVEEIMNTVHKKKILSLGRKLLKKCSFRNSSHMLNLCEMAYYLYIFGYPQYIERLVAPTHHIPFETNYNVWTYIFAIWGLEIRMMRENGAAEKASELSHMIDEYYLLPQNENDTREDLEKSESIRRSSILFSYPECTYKDKIDTAESETDKNSWRLSALFRMIGDGSTGLFPDMNAHSDEIEQTVSEYILFLQKVK